MSYDLISVKGEKENIMNYDLIRIKEEIETGEQIYELIQGGIVDLILKLADNDSDSILRSDILDGLAFRINDKLFPKLAVICQEVKQRLCFKEEIDFFIINESSSNAFAIPGHKEDKPHIVCIHSRLIDSMSEDELKFIIGHEIGHLISKNAHILNLMKFIYPTHSDKSMSRLLSNKIKYWNKLSELTADRFGYLACSKFETVVSAIFKLSSGLSLEKTGFNYSEYLEHNYRLLDNYTHTGETNDFSHPTHPFRLKALELFCNSDLAKAVKEGKELVEDKTLNEHLLDIASKYHLIMIDEEADRHFMYFIASGGLLMANADGKIDEVELELIVNYLSNFLINPAEFLQSVANQGMDKVKDLFNKSVSSLLNLDPSNRHILVNYLIELALVDKVIDENEVQFLHLFAVEGLGIPEKELFRMLAQAVQIGFHPKTI